MPHRSLAEFLDELGRIGELARIDCEVAPCLEVAEIVRCIARQQGPALLFRKIRGHDIPLVANLLGSENRILTALDAESLADAAARIERLLQSTATDGWLDRLRLAHRGGPLGQAAPHKVKTAACQQVVRLQSDMHLGELPIVTAAAEEVSGLFAAPVFFADPNSHAQGAACYEMQILGPDSLAICWPADDEPERLLAHYADLDRPMPVAVVIGGDPSVLLATMSPVAGKVDPLALAGALRGKPLDAIGCRSIDLQVPAESDFVIEGHIEPQMPLVAMGAGLNASGMLVSTREARVLQVKAITHRANAVCTTMVRSDEPNEATIIVRTLARIFLPATRAMMPSLVDLDLPPWGGAGRIAILSIQKHYAGQVQRIAALAMATPSLMTARFLIVVDENVDVRNMEQVLQAMAMYAHPALDLLRHDGPVDRSDPRLTVNELAPKITIDATRKLPGEAGRLVARRGSMPDEIVEQVAARWAEYGLGPEE